MKRLLPILALVLGAAYLFSTLRPGKNSTDFDLEGFGRVPVLLNGRIKPLDTVARTTLLYLQGRQRVSDPRKGKFVDTPTQWLADVLFAPSKADDYTTFRIDSPEVLTLMGISEADTKVSYDSAGKRAMAVFGFLPSTRSRFSYNELRPRLSELDRQARMASEIDSQLRTPFQRHVVLLRDRIFNYMQLKTSVQMADSQDFLAELVQFEKALPAGITAVLARQKGEAHDEQAVQVMREMADRFAFMEQFGSLRTIPPPPGSENRDDWRTVGAAMMESFGSGRINPNIMAYAALGHAWRGGDARQFNEIVSVFHDQLGKRFPAEIEKSDVEARFNAAQPFYSSMMLYVFAFLVAIVSWLKWPREMGQAAFWLLVLAFLAATAGIITRMWLEGRPPVTNLYSSALGVGWGAVLLCIVLERIYRNGIGSVAGGMIGFATLIIAHHLSLSGDTLEMMRAVLDTNFWLATHVVVITLGYAATFLAGFLAIIFIARGVFTSSLDKPTADSLTRMVYGIVCFATLFSLVGTVLGGIWADQSWGRFWGWDPKENGALIIVIWNAVILHARWGGMVKQRGLMAMAVFGNVVTSWSWFGTNMLGVGLHSYGFMDAAFWWLAAFVVSQVAIIGVAMIPTGQWRSFRAAPPSLP